MITMDRTRTVLKFWSSLDDIFHVTFFSDSCLKWMLGFVLFYLIIFAFTALDVHKRLLPQKTKLVLRGGQTDCGY